jgi:hypothetical protein
MPILNVGPQQPSPPKDLECVPKINHQPKQATSNFNTGRDIPQRAPHVFFTSWVFLFIGLNHYTTWRYFFLPLKTAQFRYQSVIPGYGILTFKDLPKWDYLWSGYAKTKDGGDTVFNEYNFCEAAIDHRPCWICAVENAIAFVEFIDRFVFKSYMFRELQECLIGDSMDYWFYLGWECHIRKFDELPEWCQWIINYFQKKRIVFRTTIDVGQSSEEFYVFEIGPLSDCESDIKKVLGKALIECQAENIDSNTE